MTFAAPLVLLGLLALPLLVLLYTTHQRHRARVAAAFASPALAASVSPHRPGWRRHAPMLIFMLALALLLVGAARPQTTVAVPVNHASIMLTEDVSGSMQSNDVAPSRLAAAERAAARFLDAVPGDLNVGVMEFNQRATVLQSPTTDRGASRAALGRLHVSGGTATGTAILTALQILTRDAQAGHPPAAIVLLSDGSSTTGADPVGAAQQAARRQIPVYTVALGTAQGTIQVALPGNRGTFKTVTVPPDPRLLTQIARVSGGQAYSAADTGKLSAVYQRLGSQLSHRNVKHEVTAGFAGAGAALLLVGSALSLLWFGRLA
ncbi:MAG: VWA domain-containing protein [Solirubrobacteraceae bacterium]|nr:MAG: VWA domain-containing protein [Solirubrobacterales bacterium]